MIWIIRSLKAAELNCKFFLVVSKESMVVGGGNLGNGEVES